MKNTDRNFIIKKNIYFFDTKKKKNTIINHKKTKNQNYLGN